MKVGHAGRWELKNLFFFYFLAHLLGQSKEKKEKKKREDCQLVGLQPVDQRPACLPCLLATSIWLLSNPKCTFGLLNDSCCCSGSGATNEAFRPVAAV